MLAKLSHYTVFLKGALIGKIPLQSSTIAAAILGTAGYGSLHSLVAHKDKFTDEAQRLLLEKVLTYIASQLHI